MKSIFKNLLDFKIPVIAIIVLLIIQAYCDLGLPSYTSDIVDVGIQQGGIEYAAPDEMREETLENLCLFLSDEQEDIIRDKYELNSDGNYERTTKKEEDLQEIDEILGMPMLMLSNVQASQEYDIDGLKAAISAGMMSKEQLIETMNTAVEGMGTMSDSIITQKAVEFVKAEHEAVGIDVAKYQTSYLWSIGSKMLLMAIVMMASSILVGYIASYVAARVGFDLRRKVFKKVVGFSNTEINQFSTASLITRSTNDIQQVQMVTVMLLRMVFYAPVIGIGGVIKVANTRTGMGWIIGVAVGAIILLVGVLMSVAMPKFKIMQVLVDKLNLVSREILTGVPVIRAFSREKHEEKRFDVANKELMKTQLFTNRAMTIMMPMMFLIMNCITVMIVWFGAKGVDLGEMQVGDMMAFITYTMLIVMAFLMITMISVMLPRAGVAAARIDEVINTKSTINDKEETRDSEVKDIKGIIEFKDVSFKYSGADEDALEHISFKAEPGKTTAIIGSTGCGKSTLIQLIPRFYDVTDGMITLDGIDIRDISMHKLRESLGYVPQKGVLFSGDIESNIKFSGDFVSDEEMIKAAQIAQATEFIEETKDKYKNEISQGGTNVSGGQKQRLSIARAIAKNPKVFLFDDSFSALDYKTDVTLRRALNESISDATVIIVAQRISTILHADSIIVLDDGKVAGIGTHEELLNSCEEYLEIAKSQLSEAELDSIRKEM